MSAENILSFELENAIRSTLQTKASFGAKGVVTPSWQAFSQQPAPAATAGGIGSALGTQIAIAVVSIGVIASAIVGSVVYPRTQNKPQQENKPSENQVSSTSSTTTTSLPEETTTTIIPPTSYVRSKTRTTSVPPQLQGTTTTSTTAVNGYYTSWHWLDGEFFSGDFYGLWLKTLTPINGGETIQTFLAYNYSQLEVLWESPRLNPAGHISIISDAEFDLSELVISGVGEVQSTVAVNFTYHATTEIFSIIP